MKEQIIYEKQLSDRPEGRNAYLRLMFIPKDEKHYFLVIDIGDRKKSNLFDFNGKFNPEITKEIGQLLIYNEEFYDQWDNIANEIEQINKKSKEENTNPFSTPPEWIRKSYYDAIFEILNIRTKPIEHQTKFKEDLEEVEGDKVDVEKLKKWVYATQTKGVIKKIEDKCNSLLKQREEKDIKKQEGEQKTQEKYFQDKEKTYDNSNEVDLSDVGGKPCIIHPGLYEKEGKLMSDFAGELSRELKEKRTLFYRPQSKDVVEIGVYKEDNKEDDEEDQYICFDVITPSRFITLIENYVVPGIIKIETGFDGRKEAVFKYKSITSEVSKTVISAGVFQNHIYKIERIFTVPLPIIYKGELTFPKQGYDERFKSWLPFDAPKIDNLDMNLEEAKETIINIYKEFCFKSPQDLTNAIAGLITPFLKGLFPTFNTRTPIFFYLANRERAGKDYCAGINGIIYEGHALEEPPISDGDDGKSNSSEELRKKLLSAFINGRKRLHFANNKGHINNASFEAVTTAEKYSDRVLGRNEILTFDNEIDFSLSGNIGVTYTPDFANRCRFVNLFLDIEDANSRKFNSPNLHGELKERRSEVLSAMFCLIKKWIEDGKEKGKTPFTSFPIWAEVCGGIMESAKLGDPCKQDKEALSVMGDSETNDMKLLFEVCFEKHPEESIKKEDVKVLISENEDGLFNYLDLGYSKSDQTKFGLMFDKYVGRIFSGIRLIISQKSKRASRQKYKFTKGFERQEQFSLEDFKSGNMATIGNNLPPPTIKKNKSFYSLGLISYQTLPKLPLTVIGYLDTDIPYIVPKVAIPQHTDIKQKLTQLLEKNTIKIQDFIENMKILEKTENQVNEVIQDGLKQGNWFETRPGYIKKL